MLKKSLLLTLLLALLVPWAANAQKALPYSYGFENNDLDAEGWTVQKTSSSTGISTSAKHEGSYGFQFNYSEQNAYLVSPVLSGTESGVALSFYYKESSNSYGDEQFYVGYTTDETVTDPSSFTYGDITTASLSWELYEVTLPAGTKKVAIKYVYNDALYLYLDDFTFEAPSSCPKPSGLNVALTPGNGTVATLSWTSEATAWQICLNDDETNLIAATTNPFQLTGLTPETTYTAKVRANCGSEQSGWSNEVTFKPTNAYQLTVNDGTSTNGYVPIYGYYVDAITKSQFIIPASELTAMAWGTINKMTFYASNSSISWGNAQFEVYLTETDETTLSALADYSTMTKVKNAGSLSISGNQMVVEFDTPFDYTGGNLMIGFLQTASGSWSSCNWYGVVATGASMGGYGSSISQQNFLPKTTFDYTPGEQPSCMWPTNFAVSNITARTADLSWTSEDAREWQICINDNEAALIDIETNPYTLTGLDPETVYDVKIRANCGSDDYSDWTNNINFTTEPSCYAPTDMVFTDTTAYSINVGWSPAEGNFELRYAINPTTTFDDSAMDGWTTIDADGDGYTWVLGSACGGIYLVEGGSLAGSGHNSSADLVVSGSYSNVEGVGALTPDNYLVSPRVTLGGSISFWACAQDASYPAEHFGVAVSTAGNTSDADFTTLQEWTLGAKGTPRMLRRSSNEPRGNNRDQGNWYQFTVDLSAYSGQGYVAIRHFDCTDQFMLDVDDILIEGPDGIAWIDVPNPTNPQLLTGLNDNTPYMVQVRTNCGGADGYSAWLTGTFTTLPSCMVPTDLVISNIGKRSADLAWTANGEEEAWQICLNGDEENLITVTTTSYSFTGLTPETRYTVKVRAYCDEDLQSAWSSAAIFTTAIACPAPTGLAISDITNVSAVATWTYDGDVELEYAEDVWKYYDNGTFGTSMGAGGTIYWGILLTPDMLPANQPLTHIAMYENSNNANPTTISIYSGGDAAPGTFLYSEEVTPVGNGFHEIALAEPVEFDATQNLWIVCYNDADTYPAAGSADLTNPNGRWVSLDGEEWADIDGYGYNYTWMIRAAFGDATTEWVAVNNPASPQTIAGLTPETNYVVRLRAVCGGDDGESVWVNTSFTTDEACPAPTALAATPYASSAVLSWEGISESYTVSYRTAAYTDGTTEEFSSSSTPTGWTRYNALLTDDVLNGTTALTTSSAGWNFGTGNGVFDSHAKINIYGTSIKYWLVTPAMTVHTDDLFSFDLALTAFSGTNVPAPATTGTDDKFVVLVSTDNMATWTILRQWDNEAGSAYVYNNIANTATGERVSFDFSAYVGQTVNIAFYGESTVSNADNNLHIDNVLVGTLIPATDWMTEERITETSVTLTGLTPETTYEAQVKADCSEAENPWSNVLTFTTPEEPALPLSLAAGINWVSFNVETTLDDLKAALVAALPGTAITIQSQTQKATYNPSNGRWTGQLRSIDVAKMYKIKVLAVCEITLQGNKVNPAEHPLTIIPGANWIAYELDAANTPAAVFGGFAVPGDYVKSQTQKKQYNANGRWTGQLNSLEPGQGYIYNSASSDTRPFSYDADKGSKGETSNK